MDSMNQATGRWWMQSLCSASCEVIAHRRPLAAQAKLVEMDPPVDLPSTPISRAVPTDANPVLAIVHGSG
jgi:hypothetical protein